MALFTDGPPSSIEDLSAQDAQLLTVANVEGIDVTQKLSLAWDEVGMELVAMLDATGSAERTLWQPPMTNLGAVVVTPPVRLWHTFHTLEMVYADAYNSQLNDRFAGKRDHFRERADWAREILMSSGVGIAGLPVARALKPTLAAVLPGGLPLTDATYYAAIAWVNRNGDEGSSSEPADITTTASTFAVQAGTAPENAVGWNVFAGTDPNTLTMQNMSQLTIGQMWVQPSPLASGGRPPGNGQAASYLKAVPRVIQRG